jgi:hypothetical protein
MAVPASYELITFKLVQLSLICGDSAGEQTKIGGGNKFHRPQRNILTKNSKNDFLFGSSQTSQHNMDPVYLALSKLRRRKHDECINICSTLLDQNAYDQAAWYVKSRALTAKTWIDDTDMEDQGVAELLLDENAMSSAPRYK